MFLGFDGDDVNIVRTSKNAEVGRINAPTLPARAGRPSSLPPRATGYPGPQLDDSRGILHGGQRSSRSREAKAVLS